MLYKRLKWLKKKVFLTLAGIIDQKNQLKEVAQCQKFWKMADEVEKKWQLLEKISVLDNVNHIYHRLCQTSPLLWREGWGCEGIIWTHLYFCRLVSSLNSRLYGLCHSFVREQTVFCFHQLYRYDQKYSQATKPPKSSKWRLCQLRQCRISSSFSH